MRPGSDVLPHVALLSTALSPLQASNGNGRAAPLSQVEPRICPISAPDSETRASVSPEISLKPSGFPSLRENL